MDRGELPQRLHLPEPKHRPLSSPERQVAVLDPVAREALTADVAGKHRPEPIPPHPHGLVAQIDPALEQQVLDVPERQRKPHMITTRRITSGEELK